MGSTLTLTHPLVAGRQSSDAYMQHIRMSFVRTRVVRLTSEHRSIDLDSSSPE